MKSVPVKTCTNIDCPERTGGNCNAGESVPVKSPEMEYSATYDLSRSVPVEKWEKEFDDTFPGPWWFSIGSGSGEHKDNYTAAKEEVRHFISQTIQAARIEAVEEYKSKNGM